MLSTEQTESYYGEPNDELWRLVISLQSNALEGPALLAIVLGTFYRSHLVFRFFLPLPLPTLLSPPHLRFSFSARDCNGYNSSFLPTITYARRRIYGTKRGSVRPRLQAKYSTTNECAVPLQQEKREKWDRKREREGLALTNLPSALDSRPASVGKLSWPKRELVSRRKCTKVKRRQGRK